MNIAPVTSKRLFPLGLLFLVLILLSTLPIYGPKYAVILLTDILLYVILALSWAIFSGPTGYISLASAAFFGAGMYTSAFLGKALPLFVVVGIGGLISSCLAFMAGTLTLRLRGMYFIMFTFGLSQLIKHLILWWEAHVSGTIGRFVIIIDVITVYYVILVLFVMALLIAYLIRRSRLGLALQSIGENEDAAAHRGVNVTVVKVITFALSAFFIGAAGAIMATRWTYIDPSICFNPLYSFMPVLMAIFGGLGQLYGPIIGGVIFAYLEEVLITRFAYYYMLFFGIILVIVILYLPNGFVGLIQKWRKRPLEGQHAST